MSAQLGESLRVEPLCMYPRKENFATDYSYSDPKVPVSRAHIDMGPGARPASTD
jgi:hypothetical protein